MSRREPDLRDLERSLGPVRERLGQDTWEAETATGRRLTHADALEFARQLPASR